jgi:putative ABC transport system substrate-binding protein
MAGVGAAAAYPLAGLAQDRDPARRVGMLVGFAETDGDAQARVAAYRRALSQLGWAEGRNLRTEIRWARGNIDQMRAHAADLVRGSPDVLVAVTIAATSALLGETKTIPIVFLQVSDPIGSGLIESESHPAGNVTGFTNFEAAIVGKWIELIKELAPSLARMGFIFNPDTAARRGDFYLDPFKAAAPTYGLAPVALPAHNPAEITDALARLAGAPGGALLVMPDAFTLVHRDAIIAGAAHHRLPALYPFRFFVEAGGLMSYGANPMTQYPNAAAYVDKILRGAQPRDLPVQAPTSWEFVLNLKTARALQLAIPTSLLARAQDIIE